MNSSLVDSLLNILVFVFIGLLLYLYFRSENHK